MLVESKCFARDKLFEVAKKRFLPPETFPPGIVDRSLSKNLTKPQVFTSRAPHQEVVTEYAFEVAKERVLGARDIPEKGPPAA
jgi:hypothetical protein